jgi:FkbM family methyltransferase
MIETIELPWRFGIIEVPAPDRYIRPAIEVTGEYSGDEFDLYQAMLRAGDVAVDVGANIGVFSIAMGQAVGKTGRVLAFEPQPLIFGTLTRNLARHGLERVEVQRAIVSDVEGAGQFADVRTLPEGRKVNFGTISVTSRILPEYGGMSPTPVVTLDRLELVRCDLIKIDVEGAEEAVLRGAVATIARCRPILSLECDRPNAASPWVDGFLASCYSLWRFRGTNLRVPNPNGVPIDGVANYTSIMALAVPPERHDALNRVDRTRLQPIDSRETLERLSRNIVVMNGS